MPIAEAFVAVCEMAGALGVTNVNTMPGCWEHQVDDHWWIALNGHGEDAKSSKGPGVPPYHIYAERNGWPCLLLSPAGGIVLTSPNREEGSMEDEFIAAVRATLPPSPLQPTKD